MVDRLLCSQEKALKELRGESEELYQAAIQMDFSYIPYEIKGPVETPPIPGYDPDEGDIIDISRKWDKVWIQIFSSSNLKKFIPISILVIVHRYEYRCRGE